MKKFLKKIGMLAAVTSVAFLAACGSSAEQTQGTPQEEKPAEAKTLLVGTNAAFAPFEFMDKGEIVGFDVDLLAAVMEEAGYDYQLNNLGWDPLFASLQGKQIDIAVSGITINDKRLETYDFSNPYFEATHMMVFKEGTKITSAQDLLELANSGKKIGVQNGTTGQTAAEKIIGENAPSLAKYEDGAVAFMELKAGNIEVVVTDNVVALEYQKNNPQEKVVTLGDADNFEAEFYGYMFPKGSELKASIDAALKTVIENGTYATIYEKWFGEKPDVANLVEQAK